MDPHEDFFHRMQAPTTRSMFNAISLRQGHFGKDAPNVSGVGHGHVARGRRHRVNFVVNEIVHLHRSTA